MTQQSLGVWYAADKLSAPQWIEFAKRVESLGYSTQWYSESTGFESLSFGAHLLHATTTLQIGSSIANIYARDSITARNGLATLNAISGDRYVLGLGVSHVPLVEGVRGHTYGKPVATMRRYLEGIRTEQADPDRLSVVIAALGPRMLELSAELAAGAVPYNVTPEHTAGAKAILGPDKWLIVEQKFCLETDADRARSLARQELSRYMGLPNYRNNWLRLGFSETDLANGGSDRFLDAMVVWGTPDTVRARIDEHFSAGATQVCIQPVHEPGDANAAIMSLEKLAPRAN
ncbi:MAG: TIGR03620 family F420-dependent LLM class oxidoreductase [Pseudomonadota bacterium]